MVRGVRFQMSVLRTLLIFVFVIFIAMIGFVKVKADSTIVDINDAIAIVSTAMGIKIIVEGDLKGQIPLELDNLSPREIKERLEKSLNEAGFYWVSEGGIVYITKNGRGPRTLFGRQLPLSYYLEVIARNNLFRPLGLKPEEIKTNFTSLEDRSPTRKTKTNTKTTRTGISITPSMRSKSPSNP